MGRLRRGERVEAFETARLHSGGTRIDVAVTISPIRDGDGLLAGVSEVARDIRGRKRAEEAVRASEARFRALVEKSYDGVMLLDAGGTVLYASPSAGRIGGRPPESYVGRKIREFKHPDEAAAHSAGLQELVRQPGGSFTGEGRLLHADGSWRWVESAFTNLLADPAVGAVVVNFRDVTERKAAEESLRQARAAAERGCAQLRAVISSMTEGVVIADTSGKVIDSNRAALGLHGYAGTEEARNTSPTYSDLFELAPAGGPSLPPSEWPLARVLRGETLTGCELLFRRVDGGGGRVISYGGAPVLGPDGIDLAVLTMHDVTDQRRAEAERDRLFTRLRMQIDRMPLAYILYDADLRVMDWNPAAERVFGYAREEVLGMGPPFERIIPASAWPQGQKLLQRLRSGDMAAHAVSENLTKDGRTITCEWYNTPLLDEGGNFGGLLSLTQDITEKRSLEEQLHQAQKLEAVGQLAGGVAHDFNNMICVINGYSDMLLQRLPPGDNSVAFLTEILCAGERAAALTQQLLSFSRKQVVAPKILDLNVVVTDTEKLLRRVIGEDVLLATSLAGGLGSVRADEGQLAQVLMNLAVNARDAMPQGGRLTVATSNVALDEEYARGHAGIPPGPYVLLAVSDTGCGMTPEIQRHIFEPFYTTKEVGKGTGLGLAVVHGVIKQAGGHVGVTSAMSVGTTFEVYLPRVDQPARSDKSLAGIKAPPRGTETVLLVEDDAGVRSLARHMLQSFGYTVLEASGGADALRVAERYAGPVHLLITDVVMPGLSGRQVAERLAGLHPEARVLFVSGYTDDAVVRHGIFHDKVHFLPKPFSPVALACKIRDVLDTPIPGRE